MAVTKPFFVRLEYLTPDKGWWLGHAGMNLLSPERYVERLEGNGKFGRAIELGDDNQPTGRVWVSPNLPDDPSVLVPASNNNMPCLPNSPFAKKPGCSFCGEQHAKPHDGTCLI